MKRTSLPALAAVGLLALGLTACSTGDDAAGESRNSPTTTASASPVAVTNTGHWTGAAAGATADVATTAKAPEVVQAAWKTMGAKAPDTMAVTIDNRSGSSTVALTGAKLTGQDGSVSDYRLYSTTLEANDAGDKITTSEYDAIVELHNQYSSGDYDVPAGAQRTLLLASPKAAPTMVTHAALATSVGDIELKPAAGDGPTAPDPTVGATDSATAEAAPSPTAAATPETTSTAQAQGQTQLQRYFATGGGCMADVWGSEEVPYSKSLSDQVDAYCDAHDLGDWANGSNPRDLSQMGGGQATEEPSPTAQSTTGTNGKTAAEVEQEKAECRAKTIDTATSGAIQYCWTEYGIDIR